MISIKKKKEKLISKTDYSPVDFLSGFVMYLVISKGSLLHSFLRDLLLLS